jgi:hypothetical protein
MRRFFVGRMHALKLILKNMYAVFDTAYSKRDNRLTFIQKCDFIKRKFTIFAHSFYSW